MHKMLINMCDPKQALDKMFPMSLLCLASIPNL